MKMAIYMYGIVLALFSALAMYANSIRSETIDDVENDGSAVAATAEVEDSKQPEETTQPSDIHEWMPTVPVGNTRNLYDTLHLSGGRVYRIGRVTYDYRIGIYEVTNAQYAEFLNSVAASDPHQLFSEQWASMSEALQGENSDFWRTSANLGILREGISGSYTYTIRPDEVGEGPGGSDYSFADKPVVKISFWNAIRFANWMHNGMGDGDTETGSYVITPRGISRDSVHRSRDATWVIPTAAEWYKAAYYDPDYGGKDVGGYWDYPTCSNTPPRSDFPSDDTGNSANVAKDLPYDDHYNDERYATGNSNYQLTDVGAYSLTSSAYGTFDHSGNAAEWTESLFIGLRQVGDCSCEAPPATKWWVCGGSGSEGIYTMLGFRMALINCPEASKTD